MTAIAICLVVFGFVAGMLAAEVSYYLRSERIAHGPRLMIGSDHSVERGAVRGAGRSTLVLPRLV